MLYTETVWDNYYCMVMTSLLYYIYDLIILLYFCLNYYIMVMTSLLYVSYDPIPIPLWLWCNFYISFIMTLLLTSLY